MGFFTCSPRPPTLSQRHMDLHVWSYPRPDYIFRVSSKSVQGIRSPGGSKFGLSHYFGLSLLQQLVLPYKPWQAVMRPATCNKPIDGATQLLRAQRPIIGDLLNLSVLTQCSRGPPLVCHSRTSWVFQVILFFHSLVTMSSIRCTCEPTTAAVYVFLRLTFIVSMS